MNDEYSRGYNEGHAVGFREGSATMHKATADEIDRLRAALREIADSDYASYGIRRTARAALGGE